MHQTGSNIPSSESPLILKLILYITHLIPCMGEELMHTESSFSSWDFPSYPLYYSKESLLTSQTFCLFIAHLFQCAEQHSFQRSMLVLLSLDTTCSLTSSQYLKEK